MRALVSLHACQPQVSSPALIFVCCSLQKGISCSCAFLWLLARSDTILGVHWPLPFFCEFSTIWVCLLSCFYLNLSLIFVYNITCIVHSNIYITSISILGICVIYIYIHTHKIHTCCAVLSCSAVSDSL